MPPRALRAAAAAAAATAALIACVLPLPATAAPDESARRFGAFAAVSPLAVFDFPADGHGPSAKGAMELGIGGSMAHRIGRSFELGLALRYDFGREDKDSLHLVTAAATATLVIPLGTREVRAGVGAGPGLGWLPGYGEERSALRVLGLGAELALGFAQRISSDESGEIALGLEVGARADVLGETNAGPGSYLRGGDLFHLQLLFVRTSVTWH